MSEINFKAIAEKQLLDDLDNNPCIRCARNVWGCRCTRAEINAFLKEHPMNISYNPYELKA